MIPAVDGEQSPGGFAYSLGLHSNGGESGSGRSEEAPRRGSGAGLGYQQELGFCRSICPTTQPGQEFWRDAEL
jgi:hypothetical protein